MPDLRIVGVLLVVASASTLGGCLSPDRTDGPEATPWAATWEADPCDPSAADGISGNAPVLDAFRGTPEEVARRFARALGEELPPHGADDQGGRWKEWSNDSASIQHRSTSDGLLRRLRYTTPDVWPANATAEGKAVLRDVLDRFGVPEEVEVQIRRPRSTFRLVPTLDGEPVGGPVDAPTGRALPGDGSGERGHWSAFDLGLIHDLREVRAGYPRDDARETARAYMRCVMDREGRTAEDGWTLEAVRHHGPAVRHESFAYTFQLDYDNPDPDAHCDRTVKLVYVDAETGAVLDDGIIGCS